MIWAILTIAVVALIIFLVWFFAEKTVVLRNIRKHQPQQVSSFREGTVGRVQGKVVFHGQTLHAPLSGRECSYYRVIVEEYRSSGKSGHWHKVIDDAKAGMVLLNDGTGYALLNAASARCYVVPDTTQRSGTFNDAPANIEEYLKTHAKKSTGLFGWNKSMRYKEGLLVQGEIVNVTGKGVWRDAKSLGFQLPVDKVLVFSAERDVKLYFTDGVV
ncbi:MAG: hypothetical protein MUC87_16575 [Bacteroidia bacterium]|jgi:hypothetical protein|nr:hypothetical protein [Bacteroidia bacterium]